MALWNPEKELKGGVSNSTVLISLPWNPEKELKGFVGFEFSAATDLPLWNPEKELKDPGGGSYRVDLLLGGIRRRN